MNIKELKERIEEVKITYNYDAVYIKLYDLCMEYQRETQDFIFEDIFEEFIDIETAEEITKDQLEKYGLERVYYLLGEVNFANADIIRVDAYGNFAEVNKDDLEYMKEEILSRIKEKENQKNA